MVRRSQLEPALILCDQALRSGPSKTTRALLRFSQRFEIVAVIDSAEAGGDAGEIAWGQPSGIPVVSDIQDGLNCTPRPQWLILGVAPTGGRLPSSWRTFIQEALESGLHIASGLHDELSRDPLFSRLAAEKGCKIWDVRKAPPLSELPFYTGDLPDVPRVAFLGTDASIGKRTAALETWQSLERLGVRTAMVATGQTGLLQGVPHGIVLDSLRPDYLVGVLEAQVQKAVAETEAELVIIEGQGALSHPVYITGSRAVLAGARPQHVVMTHAPGRKKRHFSQADLPMPTLDRELELVRVISEGTCIPVALALNPEGMRPDNADHWSRKTSGRLDLPIVDTIGSQPEILARVIQGLIP